MFEGQMTYGQFLGSDVFAKLFPDFDADQERAADRIASKILSYCLPSTHDAVPREFPEIKTIVDLGCGDGAVLAAIHEKLMKLSGANPPKIKCIGIDACGDMIARARARGQSEAIFEWHASSDLTPGGVDVGAIDWSTTALLCLGHTWFHMEHQEQLLAQIKGNRPAVVIVDFHASWDRAIAALMHAEVGDYSSTPPIDEEVRRLGDKYYALRTVIAEHADGGRPCVTRGIFCFEDNKWIFSTRQLARSAWNLWETIEPSRRNEIRKDGFESPGAAARALGEARERGEITGQCNYIVARDFVHPSGWGDMRCVAFVALSPTAEKLNDAYAEVVECLVRKVFGEDSSGKYGALRELVQMFGPGELALILPFDPCRTFAQMIPVPTGPVKDDEIWGLMKTARLVVERPNTKQRRFPTAFGLYLSMLSQVSSPVGFPLSGVPEYDAAWVDDAFYTIESKALPPASEDGHNSYFIIPYYFGSYPLFALILKEPRSFEMSATSANLYHALVQNLDREMNAVIVPEIIREHLVVPFLRKARLELTKSDMPKVTLAEVGQMWNAAAETQPWKSWTRALPSHKLTTLTATTEQYNKVMKAVIKEEVERLSKSPAHQIAYWLKRHAFFDSDAGASVDTHCVYCADTHNKRIATMINEGETLDSSTLAKNFDAPQSWTTFLAQRLAALMAADATEDEKSEAFRALRLAFNLGSAGEFRFRQSRVFLISMLESGIGEESWYKKLNELMNHEELFRLHRDTAFRPTGDTAIVEITTVSRFLADIGVSTIEFGGPENIVHNEYTVTMKLHCPRGINCALGGNDKRKVLMAAHGGGCNLETESGNGATFCIRMPKAPDGEVSWTLNLFNNEGG